MRLFVITHGTKDYGDAFVVRENVDGVPHAEPTAVCESLKEARGAVDGRSPGLVRLDPCEFDESVIVESWGTRNDVDQCLALQRALTAGGFVTG